MESKTFLASKTVWGVVLMALPQLLPLAGVSFGTDHTALLTQTGDQVFTAIAGLLALYGRFSAKTTLAIK